MSDHDPVRWRDAPEHAPPGALELVRSIERTPPLPPDLSALVIGRARSRPWRRWVGPSLAVAVVVGAIVVWRFVPREDEPAPPIEQPAAIEEAPVARPQAEPAAPEPAPEPAQLAMGALSVRSHPWARVYVDGRDTGRDTPLVEHALAAGSHEVELRTRAGASFRTTVEIRASETTSIAHRFDATPSRHVPEESSQAPAVAAPLEDPFEPGPADALAHPSGHGTLVIQTIPWARVLLDGRDTGRTTPVRDLRVTAGRHTIGLRTADGVVHTVTVVVEAGETTRIVRQL